MRFHSPVSVFSGVRQSEAVLSGAACPSWAFCFVRHGLGLTPLWPRHIWLFLPSSNAGNGLPLRIHLQGMLPSWPESPVGSEPRLQL